MRMWIPSRWIRLATGLLAGVAAVGLRAGELPPALPAPAPAAPKPVFALSVLFSESLFASVNRDDALAAAKVMGETITRKDGYEPRVTVAAFKDLEVVRRNLAAGTVDLVITGSREYLQLVSMGAAFDPICLPSYSQERVARYVLVAPRKTPAVTLAELHGRRLLIMQTAEAAFGQTWADVLLAEQKLERSASFFGSTRTMASASATVLPVFFGQADACIVARGGFATMAELNPQIGQRLAIAYESEPIIEGLMCMRRDYTFLRAWLIRRLLELHKEPAGRQCLTIFKLDRLYEFDPKNLEGLETLCARAAQLNTAAAKAGTATPVPASTLTATPEATRNHP